MCGIVGYIGKNVEEVIVSRLERLEYRGYDSAGLAVCRANETQSYKAIGEVSKLKSTISYCEDFGIGIGHTRWATHGGITIENCHPHFSQSGNTALVHNGIIENFDDIKSQLVGMQFYGDTDSEAAVKLVGDNLSIPSLRKLLRKITGSYAFALISKNADSIYFAKQKSPLYIAKNADGVMLASDPSCFVGFADDFISLDDGEYGKVSVSSLIIYDKNDKKTTKTPQKLDFKFVDEEKKGYAHYMLKEIYQSRLTLENIIETYSASQMQKVLNSIRSQNFERIILVGCGTAYHAALIGQHYLRQALGIDIYAAIASELQNEHLPIDDASLCIFISQSGETADSIAALEYCREKGGMIVTVTNTIYSTMARLSDFCLPLCAGQEKAVASTKAYFAQCIVLYIFSMFLQRKDFISSLKTFKNKIDYGDDFALTEISDFISKYQKLLFVGRGVDYITAKEASLKLKEISYIFSSAVPCGELKHGVIALVDEHTPSIVIATDKKQFKKTLNSAHEIKSRGGKLILFTTLNIDDDTAANFDKIISVAGVDSPFLPLQIILQLQKLAYFTAVKMGNNPDKPRNLAKSVTVE